MHRGWLKCRKPGAIEAVSFPRSNAMMYVTRTRAASLSQTQAASAMRKRVKELQDNGAPQADIDEAKRVAKAKADQHAAMRKNVFHVDDNAVAAREAAIDSRRFLANPEPANDGPARAFCRRADAKHGRGLPRNESPGRAPRFQESREVEPLQRRTLPVRVHGDDHRLCDLPSIKEFLDVAEREHAGRMPAAEQHRALRAPT